jgi:hypothetical protein
LFWVANFVLLLGFFLALNGYLILLSIKKAIIS